MLSHSLCCALICDTLIQQCASHYNQITVTVATAFALVPRELGKGGFKAHYVIAGGLVLLAASVPLMKACMEEMEMEIFEACVKIHRKE